MIKKGNPIVFIIRTSQYLYHSRSIFLMTMTLIIWPWPTFIYILVYLLYIIVEATFSKLFCTTGKIFFIIITIITFEPSQQFSSISYFSKFFISRGLVWIWRCIYQYFYQPWIYRSCGIYRFNLCAASTYNFKLTMSHIESEISFEFL